MDYCNYFKRIICEEIKKGKCEFVLYPFGERGMLVKQILNEMYGIQEKYIIDNSLCMFNEKIKPLSFLRRLNCTQYTFLITSENPDIYDELRKMIKKFVPVDNIVDLFPQSHENVTQNDVSLKETKKIGKYTYGHDSLDEYKRVECIGAFSSIANGAKVVPNHPVSLISTAPFLYWGAEGEDYPKGYHEHKNRRWYFPGVEPRGGGNINIKEAK